MPVLFHPNGPALIKVGAPGTSGTLAVLGWCQGGVHVDWDFRFYEVMADNAAGVPAEVQSMGNTARISLNLVSFDRAVLNDWLSLYMNGGIGPEPVPGTLLGFNGLLRRLVISSPLDANPYRFFFCYLMSPRALLDARANPLQLTVVALPFPTVNMLSTTALYDNVDA